MNVCTILRLRLNVRASLRAIKQLVIRDIAKLLSIKWDTIPEWKKRPRLLVFGILDQSVNLDLDESGNCSAQGATNELDKIGFRRYNRILSCLYPQAENFHLDLYVDIIGIIPRSVEDVVMHTDNADCIVSFYEGILVCKMCSIVSVY